MCCVTVDGVAMALGPKVTGISIAQIGEWIAFYIDFYVRFNLAKLINYKSVVTPIKQE
jgi:hypothetical protein